MRRSEALAAQRDRVLAIAADHGASNLRVFGSVAKGEDREGSDIDLLVSLEPGASLYDLAGLMIDFEALLGVKVDVCTERALHPELRDRIIAEARPV